MVRDSRRFLSAALVVLAIGLAGPSAGCGEEGGGAAPAPVVEGPKVVERPKAVLDSPLAGRWYDADAKALRAQIDAFLEAAPGERAADVRALVLPHAGYRWSGATAAAALKRVAGRSFRRVVVLGPSHRFPLENTASVPQATHYATPLGETAIDTDFVKQLLRHGPFTTVPRVHGVEHSVQVQVPLLQHVLGEFLLVPIVVGELDAATARRMADVLAALVDDETLVVASTDFTHYGTRFGYVPFAEHVEEGLRKLDLGAWEYVRKLDAEGFVDYVTKTRATICGRRPVEILLRMLPPDAKPALARYDTSGAQTDDWTHSVSYVSATFETRWPEREEPPVEARTPTLTQEERQALLELARGALAHALGGRSEPTPEELGVELTATLRDVRGSFVTLRREGRLRGCIGEIHASRPLYRSVMGTAVSAALHDRRFAPVGEEELDALDLHVSVLTAPSPIASWEEIEVGRHGVVLQKHGRSATFLPQVAPEQGWDRATMLSRLAMKAGLAADDWREGATFLVFEAEVFGEHDE